MEKEIHKLCEIKLLLLGKHKFANVRSICPPFGTVPAPFPPKTKVKDEETKVKTEEKPKPKGSNWTKTQVVRKITCRGQSLAKRDQNSNISTKNIILNQNRVYNMRPPVEAKRTCTKPMRESRKRNNYALLNDGLDVESPPSPKKCQKENIRPHASGPSSIRALTHEHSMSKKASARQKNIEVKDDLEDLEKIMDQTESVAIGTIEKADPHEINIPEVTPVNEGHGINTCLTNGDRAQTVPVYAKDISTNILLDSVTPNNVTQHDGIGPTNPIIPTTPVELSDNNITPTTKIFKRVTTPVDSSGNKMPMSKSSAHVTPTNYTLQGVTITNPITTANITTQLNDENEILLPDLATNKNCEHEQLSSQKTVTTHDDPAIKGEFSFSPLSSDDEPEPSTQPDEVVTRSDVPEPILTEEKDNAVSALLSLSRSVPSEASNDGLDNSELMPIGKKLWTQFLY